MAVTISGVRKHSPAYRHGIQAGERLLTLNGNQIMDVLDYRFYQLNTALVLELENNRGERRTVSLKKPEYEEIGLEFETYLMDRQHSCKNKCVFCFIDQLPKGLRKSLYFKDDDSRLSFLFGNYVTLTNLTEHEISRIIKMHISPMNISVHTTNPELRVKMMKNPRAGEALSIIRRFAQAGIKINCQIVLCPGYNDGEELKRTLSDLETMCPQVQAVAVVPVGITRYRQNLPEMRSFTRETAGEAIDLIESFGENCLQKYGTRVAYPGDEFYLKAERPLPPAGFYEDFSMLENGVGLLPLLMDEFYSALEEAGETGGRKREITIATGMAPREYIRGFLDDAIKKFPHISGRVTPIVNRFFGETITVSGLVTGTDLIEQLSSVDLGDELLIPACMLRREGDLFLDDVSLQDVEAALKVPVRPVPNDGYAFLDAILGSES